MSAASAGSPAAEVGAFDLLGPLPRGRWSIEASAGTGKTYALAGLAARFIIEDAVPVSEVLVVTFTRAAAAELRDRVRGRLTDAATALEAVIADPTLVADDELTAHLAAHDPPVRLERVRAALADFDAASITTIHGFAQQVLGTLGVASSADPDAVLADDAGELLRQVASDVLVAEALAGRHAGDELPSLDQLVNAARDVMGNPGIQVVPSADPAGSTPAAALRRRLVDQVVTQVDARRQASGTASFDDVLTRLRDAVRHPRSGPATCAALRQRFRVALIDEFQDTDPVQWQIFGALFDGAPDSGTLVLVGDPKQAIYGFRGANVHTYLDAVGAPDMTHATLAVNWRSDGVLLDAVEALLDGATFGDPRIRFHPVQAQPGHVHRRLGAVGSSPPPALSVRLAVAPDLERVKKRPFAVTSEAGQRAVFADLADRVRDLLVTGRIPDDQAPTGDRPVSPRDVAVLIMVNTEGPKVRDALTRAGIPAVIARGDSVLRSPAATQWRWLLEAVAQPADPLRARTACLSWFVGWSADELAAAAARDLAAVQEQLHRWGDTLLTRGISEFVRVVWAEGGVAARVLAGHDGDRALTDLDHLTELLSATATRRTGPVGLLALLDQLTAQAAGIEPELDATARRIESEADAVQIMTVHASKGLEFPVVCLPTMWRAPSPPNRPTVFFDPDGERRTIDVAVGCPWPDADATEHRKGLGKIENAGQNLRLLYVALTRARHHTLLWWCASGAHATGLARVLFARDDGVIDPAAFGAEKVALPPDPEAADALGPVVERAAGTIGLATVGPPGPVERWAGEPARPLPTLQIADLGRVPDRHRQRWSFTAITRDVHAALYDPIDASLGDAGAGDEQQGDAPDDGAGPDDRATADPLVDMGDEVDVGAEVDVAAAPADAGSATGAGSDVATADGALTGHDAGGGPGADDDHALPLAGQRGGAAFGTLVHRVLEHVDFAAPDLTDAVRAQVVDAVHKEGLPVDEDAVVHGLVAALTTPLGPVTEGRALCEFAAADRLDELSFQLTLGEAGASVDDLAIGALLQRHLALDDPYRPWADIVADGRFGTRLAGQLVGSIDLVLRVRGDGAPDRYVVIDYKSNDLTERGEVPGIADYEPSRLPDAMAHADYPLQALLYAVALHRYLRWRVADYDPVVHLGGAAYLFLRGMIGPATPTVDGRPAGVAAWPIPAALVVELSDLLDGRVVAS